MFNDLIIASAAPFESEPLKKACQDRGIKAEFVYSGIGSLNAARESKDLAQRCRDKDVIFIGTCGTFGSFSQPYLVSANKTIWLPIGERVRKSYPVQDLHSPIDLPTDAYTWQEELEKRIVVCAPSISMETSAIEGFSREDLVENLELYSVASDLMDASRNFAVLLCVTNSLRVDAHKQWRENAEIAAHMTREFLVERIAS